MEQRYPEYETFYTRIDKEARRFDDLVYEIQMDLLEWFNVKKPSEGDKQMLLELYQAEKFKAWNCPGCDERVYRGEPDSWGNFQGILNQDFSYFGNKNKYTEEYILALCDDCRYNA
jgi:hypothetical protein